MIFLHATILLYYPFASLLTLSSNLSCKHNLNILNCFNEFARCTISDTDMESSNLTTNAHVHNKTTNSFEHLTK